MTFRERLVETILNIGEAQIEKGKFNSLADSFLVRELIRLELILSNGLEGSKHRDLRLTRRGKELYVREMAKRPEVLSELLSRFGRGDSEEALKELVYLDFEE